MFGVLCYTVGGINRIMVTRMGVEENDYDWWKRTIMIGGKGRL